MAYSKRLPWFVVFLTFLLSFFMLGKNSDEIEGSSTSSATHHVKSQQQPQQQQHRHYHKTAHHHLHSNGSYHASHYIHNPNHVHLMTHNHPHFAEGDDHRFVFQHLNLPVYHWLMLALMANSSSLSSSSPKSDHIVEKTNESTTHQTNITLSTSSNLTQYFTTHDWEMLQELHNSYQDHWKEFWHPRNKVKEVSEDHPLFFFHQRKAGGTSVRTSLNHVSEETGLSSFIVCFDGVDCDTYQIPSVHYNNKSASLATPSMLSPEKSNKHTKKAIYGGHIKWGEQSKLLPPPSFMLTGNNQHTSPSFSCVSNLRDPIARIESCLYFRFDEVIGNRCLSLPDNATSFSPQQIKKYFVSDSTFRQLLMKKDVFGTGCLHEPFRMLSGIYDEQMIDTLSSVSITSGNQINSKNQGGKAPLSPPPMSLFQHLVFTTTYQHALQCSPLLLELPDTFYLTSTHIPTVGELRGFALEGKTNAAYAKTRCSKLSGSRLALVKQYARLELVLYEMLYKDIQEALRQPVHDGWKKMVKKCWPLPTALSLPSNLKTNDRERVKKELIRSLPLYREWVNGSYAALMMAPPAVESPQDIDSPTRGGPLIIIGKLMQRISSHPHPRPPPWTDSERLNHIYSREGYTLRALLEYASGSMIGAIHHHQYRGRYDCGNTFGMLMLDSRQLRFRPSNGKSGQGKNPTSWPVTDFESPLPPGAYPTPSWTNSTATNSTNYPTPGIPTRYDVQRSICTTRGQFSNALVRLRELKNVMVITRDPFYNIWKVLKDSGKISQDITTTIGENEVRDLLMHALYHLILKEDNKIDTSFLNRTENADSINKTPKSGEQSPQANLEEFKFLFYIQQYYFLFFDFATFQTLFSSDADSTLREMQQQGKNKNVGSQPIKRAIHYSFDVAWWGGISSVPKQVVGRRSFVFSSYEAIVYSAFKVFNEEVLGEEYQLLETDTNRDRATESPTLVDSSHFIMLAQNRTGLPFKRSRAGCAFSLVPEIDEELIMHDIPAMAAFYEKNRVLWESVSTFVEDLWQRFGMLRRQRSFVLSSKINK